jgi:hypothetical protein
MYLPWKRKGQKFMLLLRMCKEANKNLLACGFAFQTVIYLLATNYATGINIINSNGDVKSIEDIAQIPSEFIMNLKKNDYFLDFVSGDLFHYHKVGQNWMPIMNVGLHKMLTAEKYSKLLNNL